MENGFQILEDKVKKAAELVKRLRRENKSLEEDLTKSRWKLQEAEKRLDALEKEAATGGPKGAELEGLTQELQTLRSEREEVRRRIAKLVEVLDGLES